jgi:sortase (surface protein transpeptidase)
MVRQHLFRQVHSALALLCCCCLVACGAQESPVSQAHADGPAIFAPGSAAVGRVGPGIPLRLLIPAIGVNAPVEQVGVTANGDLGTPAQSPWANTGWYVNGPRPGEQGSSVIDGHLNRPGNAPAVFWRLYQLHAGNEVDVLDSRGRALRFRVLNLAYYTLPDAPYQFIFGNNSGKYLNLITCAGDWIRSQHQTTQRLVVYTRLI